MESQPFDAQASELVLHQFYRCLNASSFVPAKVYRRNSSYYPLLCYVNNLVAAAQSGNDEVVPIFVARAAEHMTEVKPSQELVSYYALVTSYLSHLVHHLRRVNPSIEFDAERIPPAILAGGPQQAPNPSIERTASGGLRPPPAAAHVER
jgi:hypothetical protein